MKILIVFKHIKTKIYRLMPIFYLLCLWSIYPVAVQALPLTDDTDESIQPHSEQIDPLKIEKLVSFINTNYPVKQEHAADIVGYAIANATKHGLDPELILAVIAVESTFRPSAVSAVGARGLMQVMPKPHAKKVAALGGVDALFEPEKNIHVGTNILVEYLALSKGNLTLALQRYNGNMPDKETRYAKKVMSVYSEIKGVSAAPPFHAGKMLP